MKVRFRPGNRSRPPASQRAARRRLPLSAVQAFGDMLGGTIRPACRCSLPSGRLETVGGGTVQSVGTSFGRRRPGPSTSLSSGAGIHAHQVDGRLFALGQGLGFVGGAAHRFHRSQESFTWLTGNPASSAQIKPWHAIGDVTLSAAGLRSSGCRRR